MPKELAARKLRPSRQGTATAERRARAIRVQEIALEMTFRCKKCEKENLRCFVDTATGRCAGCIAVHAECSLFVSETEWEKVAKEKREMRLQVAQLKAQLAASEVELLKVESREQEYASRDMAMLRVQDQAQETEGSSAVTPSSAVCTSADPGWSQVNDLLDLSPDQLFVDFLLANPSHSGSFLSSFLDGLVDTALTAGGSS